MTELTFAILKNGLLVALWIFAFLAIRSLHNDVTAPLAASHRRGHGRRGRGKRGGQPEQQIYVGSRHSGPGAGVRGDGMDGARPTVPLNAEADAARRMGAQDAAAGRANAAAQPVPPNPAGADAARNHAYSAYQMIENPGSDNAIESPFLAHLVNSTESREAAQEGRKLPTATMLVIIDGPRAGYTVPLEDKPITLGRGTQNTIVLSDEYVSGRHARVFKDSATGQWKLEDLGSTNGTYVNEARINGAITLPPRVPVRIGATSFELR